MSNKIKKTLAKKALEFLTADAHCKPLIDMGQDTEARDNMKELYNGWKKLQKQKKNRDTYSEEECTLFEQMRKIDTGCSMGRSAGN